jgi:hypothetical protein
MLSCAGYQELAGDYSTVGPRVGDRRPAFPGVRGKIPKTVGDAKSTAKSGIDEF